jgi:hypothetical protein
VATFPAPIKAIVFCWAMIVGSVISIFAYELNILKGKDTLSVMMGKINRGKRCAMLIILVRLLSIDNT